MFKTFLKFSFGSWVSAAISFFTVPITTLLINPAEFGRTAVFIVCAAFLLQVELLGGDSGFMRFFYEKVGKERSQLLWNAILPGLLVWCVLSLFLLLSWKQLSIFLIGEKSMKIVWVLCIQLFLMLWERYAFLVVRMKQKGLYFSVIRIISAIVVPCFLIFYAEVVSRDFYAVLYANMFSLLLSLLILIFSERKDWFSKIHIDKNLMKSILAFGMPMAITALMAVLFEALDKLFLRKYSTFEELGLYNAAFKIVSVLTLVQATFSTVWTPICYEHYEKHKEDSSFYAQVFRYILFVLIVCGLGIILCKDVLILILNKQYRVAAEIVPFLVFMPIMYTLTEITTIGINFTKKTCYYLIVFVLLIMLSPLYYYLLVPNYGGKGAAMALALSYMTYFFLRTYFSVRLYTIHLNIRDIVYSYGLLFGVAFLNTLGLKSSLTAPLTLCAICVYIWTNHKILKKIIAWGRLKIAEQKFFLKTK